MDDEKMFMLLTSHGQPEVKKCFDNLYAVNEIDEQPLEIESYSIKSIETFVEPVEDYSNRSTTYFVLKGTVYGLGPADENGMPGQDMFFYPLEIKIGINNYSWAKYSCELKIN